MPTEKRQRLVLVVDDEGPVREVTAAMLRTGGYSVLTAADGLEALRRLRENQMDIDLLLTDIMMPQMDGLTLASQVLQICPRARILLMSGFADMLAQAKATRRPFLAKPFGMETLLNSVSAALADGGPETELQVA